MLEFFGKSLHIFLAIDFDKTFSFFIFFDSKGGNKALGGFLCISCTYFNSFESDAAAMASNPDIAPVGT